MENRQVIIKNMYDSVVSVVKPEYGIQRKWNKMGQAMAIPYDIVEQLLWDRGFRNLIENGILYIEDMKTKIDLGLEPEGATEPVNIRTLNEEDKKNLWNAPIAVFKKEISDLPTIQVDALVEYAILNDIADAAKCNYIKEITGKDILVSISRKHADELEEAKAKENAR